jgi:hypothetical protein
MKKSIIILFMALFASLSLQAQVSMGSTQDEYYNTGSLGAKKSA